MKHAGGSWLGEQGDPGDQFYIIKEGEAVVYQQTAQGTRKVNHLFKADFFGERALLTDEPRAASVEAITKLRSGLSVDCPESPWRHPITSSDLDSMHLP